MGSENVHAVQRVSDDSEKVGTAILVLPSHLSREELDDIVAATKNGVLLTGSLAKAQFGPSIGLVDIGECEDYYLFRVSLPGVKSDESKYLVLCQLSRIYFKYNDFVN